MPALAETAFVWGRERESPNVFKLETKKEKLHCFIYVSNLATFQIWGGKKYF